MTDDSLDDAIIRGGHSDHPDPFDPGPPSPYERPQTTAATITL